MQKTLGKKNLLALLLALTMLCGLLPIQAFAAEKYTVWFESDTGASIRKIEVPAGSTIEPPAMPRKSNSYFVGWYTDEQGTDRWNFRTDKVNQGMTLYARWDERDDDADSYYGYGNPYYYYSNPYRDDYYYDDSYRYNYYGYYNNYYYWDNDNISYSDWMRRYGDKQVDVEGAEGQVYRGSETVSFTVYEKSVSSLLAVIVYPKGDRNNERVLKKGDDYSTNTDKGLKITLKRDYLDMLKNGKYEVRIFFTTAQGEATFTVK